MKNTIYDYRQTINPPNTWNKCTKKQALLVYSFFMKNLDHVYQIREVSPAERIFLTRQLLKVDFSFFSDWKKNQIIKYGEDEGESIFLEELIQYSDKVTQPYIEKINNSKKPNQYQLRLGLTKCPYPKLEVITKKGKIKTFYAPVNSLSSISLLELGITFDLFEKYIQALEVNNYIQANSFMLRLLAVLFREKKSKIKGQIHSVFHDDPRKPFSNKDRLIEKRMSKIRVLPESTKQMILFWFASCRQLIINRYQNLFIPSDETNNIYGHFFEWGKMLIRLTEKSNEFYYPKDHNAIDVLAHINLTVNQKSNLASSSN